MPNPAGFCLKSMKDVMDNICIRDKHFQMYVILNHYVPKCSESVPYLD